MHNSVVRIIFVRVQRCDAGYRNDASKHGLDDRRPVKTPKEQFFDKWGKVYGI